MRCQRVNGPPRGNPPKKKVSASVLVTRFFHCQQQKATTGQQPVGKLWTKAHCSETQQACYLSFVAVEGDCV